MSRRSSDDRYARLAFSALLRFYPRAFRGRHGDAMLRTFLDAWRERPDDLLGRSVFWLRAAVDMVRHGILERFASWKWNVPADRVMGVGMDLRLALRSLQRGRVFAMLVVVTLALGIGANVAVLSLVDAVLLRPLPVRDASALVAVHESLNARSSRGGVSYPTYRDLAAARTGLTGLAARVEQNVELLADGLPVRASLGLVSGNYFQVLGVRAEVGRTLISSDELGREHAVAVISHRLWSERLARDPSVLGATVRLNGVPVTVVGVAAAGFRGVSLANELDLWVPIPLAPRVDRNGLFGARDALSTRSLSLFRLVGRLDDGITPERATSMLNDARRRAHAESIADDVSEPMSVVPLTHDAVGAERASVVRFLILLGGVVLLTLLVACVNVANLMLVRVRRRTRDLSVQFALGAGRGRIFRQVLLEAGLLAIAGGAAALIVARAMTTLLAGFTLPGAIPVEQVAFRSDQTALAVAFALALGTLLLCGVVPAARATRIDAEQTLRARVHAARAAGRWGALIAAQVAMSVILLVTGALFARTLREALQVDLGFSAESVVAVSVGLRQHGYDNDAAVAFVRSALEELRRAPGVSFAAFALHVPPAPRAVALPVEAIGARVATEEGAQEPSPSLNINVVAGDFFDLFEMPIIAGRAFGETDGPDSERVAVLNQAAARRLWDDGATADAPNPSAPDGGVIDRRVRIFPPFGRETRVAGLVRDAHYHSVAEPDAPYGFFVFGQETGIALDRAHFLVKSSSGAAAGIAALRETLQRLDPTLPIFDARRVDRQIDNVLAPQRFGAALLGLFSVLALVIACVGIYGVAAHTVASKRREIGIRLALGAPSRNVVASVIGNTALAALTGAFTGILAAAALTRFVAAFLFGVRPLDPAAFATALAAMSAAALIAAAAPVRRALAVDPVESIRID